MYIVIRDKSRLYAIYLCIYFSKYICKNNFLKLQIAKF